MFSHIKTTVFNSVTLEKKEPGRPRNFIIDSDIYRNPVRFAKEHAVLIDTNLGPLEELRTSEKYLVTEEEKIKVYLNSCPHRGAHLNQAGSNFKCAYHGWEFDKDGNLQASTGPHCPFPKGALKLRAIPVTDVSGMIISGPLTDLTEEIRTLFPRYHFIEKRSHYVATNWKFLVESLLETYHFPFAHAPYLENFDNAFFSQRFQSHRDARLIVPLADLPEQLDKDSLNGINIMSFIFPYSFVLHMSSGFVWFHILPKSVEESVLNMYLYSYNEDESAARQSLAMLNKILDQDFEILERQQRNTETPQRYHFTGYENLIKEFHRHVNEALSTASESS